MCCSVLQRVAAFYSVLQRGAACHELQRVEGFLDSASFGTFGVLQRVAACCSVLQYVAACCNVLQCVAACSSVSQFIPVCCSVLQRVAACRK